MPIPAVRLNHAVLYVSDIQRSVKFWTTALDMDVVSEFRGAAFLTLSHGTNDHDLGLFEVGASAPSAGPRPGLYHLAWQVDTIDQLAEAHQTLSDLGALVGQSSHGTTKSLYAKDPDGIEFEVMWMLPQSEWAAIGATGGVAPLDLAAEVEKWAGVQTAAELIPKRS